MLCPACQFDNIAGEDVCASCGADLWNVDVPDELESFHGRLLGEHLAALGGGSPATVDVDAPADAAIARMRADGIDCLLITEAGRLVGIFTERDAVLKLAGRPVAGVPIALVMTPDPVVLRHDDTLGVAINKMAVGGFRHIPIVDGNTAIGVVAARDVFRHLLSALG